MMSTSLPAGPGPRPRRRRRWSVLTLLVAAAAAASVLSACQGSTGSTSGTPTDTLMIANPVKVDTLDPEVSSVTESI
ncbi:MAG: hypothetical protein ACR2I1_01200 [Propionibacteriaceae bacterium]